MIDRSYTRKLEKFRVQMYREHEKGFVYGVISINGIQDYKTYSYSAGNVKRHMNKRIKQMNQLRGISPPIPQIRDSLATKEHRI